MKVLFILALLTLAACSEEDPLGTDTWEQTEHVKVLTFNSGTCRLKADPSKNSGAFIIKDKQQFDDHFSCPDALAKVDFDKYMLVSGYTTVLSCARLKDQQIEKTGEKLVYHVQIRQLACSSIDTVRYGLLIPRQYALKTIEFDVKIVR